MATDNVSIEIHLIIIIGLICLSLAFITDIECLMSAVCLVIGLFHQAAICVMKTVCRFLV